MNKKTILIIILAGLLAFLGAISILNIGKEKQISQPLPELEETQLPIAEEESIVVNETEEKLTVKQPVSKVVNKKVPAKKVVTAPKVNPPTVKPIIIETPANAQVQKAEIIQEENSKDIVITKEYKMLSPAKYTFK